MRYAIFGGLILILGFILLIYAGFQGGFLLIFPFIITYSSAGALGILLIIAGIMMVFYGMAVDFRYGREETAETVSVEKRGLAFIMVGPIPLIIDTRNRRLTFLSITILLIVIIVVLLLFL